MKSERLILIWIIIFDQLRSYLNKKVAARALDNRD